MHIHHIKRDLVSFWRNSTTQGIDNDNLISNLPKNRELQSPVTYRHRHKNPKKNNINNKSNFTCVYI